MNLVEIRSRISQTKQQVGSTGSIPEATEPVSAKMIWSEWKAPKGKNRVWATCPKTNWLMLVDVDLVNSVSTFYTLYSSNIARSHLLLNHH